MSEIDLSGEHSKCSALFEHLDLIAPGLALKIFPDLSDQDRAWEFADLVSSLLNTWNGAEITVALFKIQDVPKSKLEIYGQACREAAVSYALKITNGEPLEANPSYRATFSAVSEGTGHTDQEA